MEVINIIVACIVGIICLKWIFLLPMCIAWRLQAIYYQSPKKTLLRKIIFLSPNKLVEKSLGGGGGVMRFYTYKLASLPSISLRKLIYRIQGVKCGKHVTFHYGTQIRAPYRLRIGDGCIIGDNAMLDARNQLSLGKNVALASNVQIYTMQHNHRDPYFGVEFPGRKLSVEIDTHAWIGCNAIILPGVHIGEGAVVCAGAVVCKDVEPFTVVAGSPAVKVNTRPSDLRYEFTRQSCNFY